MGTICPDVMPVAFLVVGSTLNVSLSTVWSCRSSMRMTGGAGPAWPSASPRTSAGRDDMDLPMPGGPVMSTAGPFSSPFSVRCFRATSFTSRVCWRRMTFIDFRTVRLLGS